MSRGRSGRDVATLGGLAALAGGYGSALPDIVALSGAPTIVGGMIGVILGLYVCSHPAANAIDLLFFDRGHLTEASWGGLGWLLLNGLVLLVGWLAIVAGAMHLVG